MRLWHTDLIKYLPKQQLLGQWRELNSIFAKEDKHILINFVYEYDVEDLFNYSVMIYNEMIKRHFILDITRLCRYFDEKEFYALGFTGDELDLWSNTKPFKNHMNEEYLKICCWNLYEKYIRGQKGFTDEAIKFIKKQIGVK